MFEGLLICAAGALALGLALGVVRAASLASALWVLPAGLVLGVVAADFASGTAHWFCDRFFSADTPLLGSALIAPFREHHDDPLSITRHGPLELHGNSCLPVVPVLLLAHALPDPASVGGVLGGSALLFFALASMATNQCHRWAHEPAPAKPVVWLQRHGFILSPEMHARHHSDDFNRSFCMTTGWLNPLLDRIAFFPRLERRIRALRPTTD